MNEKYTIEDLRHIAEHMVETLREYEDGTVTTTRRIIKEAGYNNITSSELSEIHKYLLHFAKANQIKLEISDNADVQPYDLEFTVKNKKAQIKCLYCGSKNTARYIYGYPILSDEMRKMVASGKRILGGCMISSVKIRGEIINTMPQRKYYDCKKNFATEPILITKKYNTAEDYRDIVTEIQFSIGNNSEGFTEITIKENDKGALVSVKKTGWPDNWYSDRQITMMKWFRTVNELYKYMYLHEWKKKYVNPDVMDGTQWSLGINLVGKRKRSYHGIDDYPPYWKELLKIFRQFAKI